MTKEAAAGMGAHAVAAAVAAGRRGRRLLLLSDFDGTLCEFEPDPAAVSLPPARRVLLGALAARPDVIVGLVSGRRLPDLRARAGLDGPVFYAGLHGLEIEGPGTTFLHPAVADVQGLLRILGRALQAHVADLPGVFVENKQLSIALHVREAADGDRRHAERAFARIAGPQLEAQHLRLLAGEKVYELLPDIAWNKGSAVRWIRETVERGTETVCPVYLGDDLTDEDAFAVLEDGLIVVVGDRASRAALRLRDPAEVEALLRQLAA